METRMFLGLIGLAVLCGCSEAPKPAPVEPVVDKPPVEDGPELEPAPAALVIQVFLEDTDTGIAARVDALDGAGQARFLANVGETGIARLADPCAAGDRLDADPVIANYLRVEPLPCAPTVTFRLYGAQATRMLIRAAEDDERNGKFTEAQQKYSEAARRLRYSQPEEANRVQQRALRNAGAALGIDAAASVVGDQASPQLVEGLQRFQREANLPVTGTLDEQTQERLLRRGATVPER